MYAVSFMYSSLSPHCFPFSSFQGKFCVSPSTMAPFSVTAADAFLFHGIYQFPHLPRVWPLVRIAVTIGNSIPSLSIFTIWRVAGWQRSMRRPPWTTIQNGPPFIIESLVSRRRLARGSVPQMFRYIYAQPQKRPGSGYAKHILPLMADAAALARTRMPEWSPIGGWGVVSWTRTLWHGDSNTPSNTTLYITCRTSPTRADPQKIRLGPGMC